VNRLPQALQALAGIPPSDKAAPPGPRVLWVDDQATDDDALVRLAGCDGIVVECAASVADALCEGRAARFDGLVLDLNLPDGSGLDLLERLRAQGVQTPVLVLTGFGDTESALTAGRLGAIGFKHKPMSAEEWVDSVRDLVNSSQQPRPSQFRADSLSALEGLPAAERPFDLARILTTPTLDIVAFIVCAGLLRSVVSGEHGHLLSDLAGEAERAIRRLSLQLCHAERSRAYAALDVLRRRLERRCRPSPSEVALELGVAPQAFEHDLEVETGRPFAEWRSAVAVMLGARQLATSSEQVSQIAYALGFNHLSQFDREFHRQLGLSPRAFRLLLNKTGSDPSN